MNGVILQNIDDKDIYMLMVKATNGGNIDSDELEKILSVYKEIMAKYDIIDESLIKYMMYFDIDCLKDGFISDEEKEYLGKLVYVYKGTKHGYDVASISIQDVLSNTTLNESLKMALARSILDRLSHLSNIALYKDNIDILIEYISTVDKDVFNQVSIFLGFIRSRY